MMTSFQINVIEDDPKSYINIQLLISTTFPKKHVWGYIWWCLRKNSLSMTCSKQILSSTHLALGPAKASWPRERPLTYHLPEIARVHYWLLPTIGPSKPQWVSVPHISYGHIWLLFSNNIWVVVSTDLPHIGPIGNRCRVNIIHTFELWLWPEYYCQNHLKSVIASYCMILRGPLGCCISSAAYITIHMPI